MSTPSTLLQAAMHRLVVRMGSALADTAASLAVLAQDAPARVQQELTLFWQEVEMEAERLQRGESAAAASRSDGSRSGDPPVDPQEQIDRLRERVAELARRLELESPLS